MAIVSLDAETARRRFNAMSNLERAGVKIRIYTDMNRVDPRRVEAFLAGTDETIAKMFVSAVEAEDRGEPIPSW